MHGSKWAAFWLNAWCVFHLRIFHEIVYFPCEWSVNCPPTRRIFLAYFFILWCCCIWHRRVHCVFYRSLRLKYKWNNEQINLNYTDKVLFEQNPVRVYESADRVLISLDKFGHNNFIYTKKPSRSQIGGHKNIFTSSFSTFFGIS